MESERALTSGYVLTEEQQRYVIEHAADGPSALARAIRAQWGIPYTKQAVSAFLANREQSYTALKEQRDAEAQVHRLDSEDALAGDLYRIYDACVDILRQKTPSGAVMPSEPYKVTTREIPAVQAADRLANTIMKLRGWGRERREVSGPDGEVLRVEEVKRVIVSRA